MNPIRTDTELIERLNKVLNRVILEDIDQNEVLNRVKMELKSSNIRRHLYIKNSLELLKANLYEGSLTDRYWLSEIDYILAYLN